MTRGRIAILVVIVAIAAGVAWYLKRPADRRTPIGTASGTGGTVTGGGAGAGGGGAPGSGSDDGAEEPDPRYRVIDSDARMALMERIKRAREARLAGKPAPTTAASADDPPALPGELTPDEIMAGIMPVMPLFKDCYEQGLERRTVKNGQVRFTMHLAGEPGVGTLVETAELDGDPAFLADAELSTCLQETMMSVELPPMTEGTTLKVITTMQFEDEPSEPAPDAR